MCSFELQYVLPACRARGVRRTPNEVLPLVPYVQSWKVGYYLSSSSCAKRVIVSGDTDHDGLPNDDNDVVVVGVFAR